MKSKVGDLRNALVHNSVKAVSLGDTKKTTVTRTYAMTYLR